MKERIKSRVTTPELQWVALLFGFSKCNSFGIYSGCLLLKIASGL